MDFRKLSLFLFLPLLLLSCADVPTLPASGEAYQIKRLSISPQQADFTPADGIRDTLLQVQVSAEIERLIDDNSYSDANLIVQLRGKSSGNIRRELIAPLNLSTGEPMVVSLPVDVQTIDFSDFLVSVFIGMDEDLISNTAASTLKIRGFSPGNPVLESASNPDVVIIPEAGTTEFKLTARVFHPFDQELIDRVLVNIRDQNNNMLSGSPFQLFDDGGDVDIGGGSGSGDLVAGDSTFTRTFQIGTNNNPDVYTLFYFAVDNFGGSSDTLQTQMIIRR